MNTYAAVVVAASLLSAGSSLAAQELTADDVVEKCAAALGGRAKWQAIESMEWTGDYSSYTQTHPFRLWRGRPDLYRFDHADGTRETVFVYDGELPWWHSINIFNAQANWPLVAREPFAQMIRNEAQFDGPCLRAGEDGVKVVFLGEIELDSELYLGLELTLPTGSLERWYLDPKTYLPAVRVSTAAYQARVAEQVTFFLEYQEVDGVMIPHLHEIEIGNDVRSLEVHEVEIGAKIAPEALVLPVSEGMAALQGLAGRWHVKVESFDHVARTWTEQETSSEIRAVSRGDLLEEEIDFLAAGFLRQARRSYSYDRFRKLLKIAHFDNFTSHLDILEGERSGEEIVLSNVTTGTEWSLYQHTFHGRETLRMKGEDAFEIERQRSVDGGVTWGPDYKLSYRRRAD